MPDGSPAYDQTRQQWRTGKLSYQATAGNRFIGFQQWGKKFERSKTSEVSLVRRAQRPGCHDAPDQRSSGRGCAATRSSPRRSIGTISTIRSSGSTPTAFAGRTDVVTQTDHRRVRERREQADFGHEADPGASVTWYKPNWFTGTMSSRRGSSTACTRKELGTEVVQIGRTTICSSERRALPVRRLQRPGRAVRVREHVRQLRPGQLDRRASADAESGACGSIRRQAFFPEQCREAATAPSDVVFPAGCFSQRGAQHLEQRGAAPPCRLRSVGRRQDGDQGRIGALRSHAPARARRAARGRQRHRERRLPRGTT